MSSFFYSQQITYCQCIMPREIGWQAINQLGELQCVHFQQRQVNYQNPYSKSLKRCEEALGKLRDIKSFINQIKPMPHHQNPKAKDYKQMLKQFKKQIDKQRIHGYLYINQIEDEIKSIHDYLSRQKKQLEGLDKDLHQKIIDLALFITLLNQDQFKVISRQKNLLENSNLFDFKCVIINRKDLVPVEKGLFRISRGHCWVKSFNIDSLRINFRSLSNSESAHDFHSSYQFLIDKLVCIIMFQFGQNNTLLNKINRYLSCMDITTTQIPVNHWQQSVKQLEKQIKQIENIKVLTNDAIQRYLYKLYEPYGQTNISLLHYLQTYAIKESQIYRKLASTKQSKSFLHFNIYIPTKSLPLKLNLPQKLPPLTLTPKSIHPPPPTKYPTSTILQIPQQILNTYGIPSYSQFNPAPLYIVTFAFFIGVMFGDIGHMLMAIPWLIYFKVNVWAWIVVFFMGYCGLIYGEFLGLAVGIWNSCYQIPIIAVGEETARAIIKADCVYPIGIDPIWKVAQNQMQFINSFKMKFAVIIGVTQMLLGICLKLLNMIRNKKHLQMITVAIPQLIFMLCTFFYMDFLIIYKWNSNYSGQKSKQAPSIIGTMIATYAGFGDAPYLFWAGQRSFQKFVVILAYIMIPIMLLGVPIVTWYRRKVANGLLNSNKDIDNHQFNDLVDEKMGEQIDSGGGSQEGMSERANHTHSHKKIKGKHGQQQMSQIVVHSFIQTIQYVLGAVSNTASYLRLWALSLAHGQLSQVIFDLILKSPISGGYSKIIASFLAFIFYYSVTFGVLICMDSMECFLHALRLHWVEFQNKFYQGKGYKFQAFTFKKIVDSVQNTKK